MSAQVYTSTVRAAADLGVGATATTSWVSCHGAKAVMFLWRATNGNGPQSSTAEGTFAKPLVAGGAARTLAQSHITSSPSVGSVDLSILGGMRQVVFPTSGPYLTIEGVRATMLGHAAATITGLSCEAEVFYDDDELADAFDAQLGAV